MRTAFVDRLVHLAEKDERIHLITADLGFTVVERFRDRFPARYLNVGVAEQNMIGVATGLAQLGFIPFCYSIATFTSLRGYEQLRNGPVLHALPVRLVGIGGGYAYGHASFTHFALEDLAVMRVQPGMTTLAPADPSQVQAALTETYDLPGPIYYRVGKGGNPPVPGLEGRFALHRPEVVRQGTDVLFVTTGDMALEAVKAADKLSGESVSAAIAVMAHLPHAPPAPLIELLSRFAKVVSVEEGYSPSGLGGLVAQAIACAGLRTQLEIAGIGSAFGGRSGSVGYMRSQVGLDCDSLVRRTLGLLRR
jgi:transketolase